MHYTLLVTFLQNTAVHYLINEESNLLHYYRVTL